MSINYLDKCNIFQLHKVFTVLGSGEAYGFQGFKVEWVKVLRSTFEKFCLIFLKLHDKSDVTPIPSVPHLHQRNTSLLLPACINKKQGQVIFITTFIQVIYSDFFHGFLKNNVIHVKNISFSKLGYFFLCLYNTFWDSVTAWFTVLLRWKHFWCCIGIIIFFKYFIIIFFLLWGKINQFKKQFLNQKNNRSHNCRV